MVIPRFTFKLTMFAEVSPDTPVDCKAPPLKVIELAVALDGTAPKLLSDVIAKIPALMVVPPEYPLLADNVVVPVPDLFNTPVPLIALVMAIVDAEFKERVALLVTTPEPKAPPLPICNMPALTVVPPEYVLDADDSIVVPEPS